MLNNTSGLLSFQANGGLQVETPYDIHHLHAVILFFYFIYFTFIYLLLYFCTYIVFQEIKSED